MVVGCYYRVSTQGQEKKGTSLEEQKAKGEAFASKNGWDYRPIGDVQSGKDAARKGYLEILDAIDENAIDVVWIVDESRFSRDAIQGLTFLNSLIEKKIRLFVGDTERDPTDPSTYTLLGIKFIFSQQEWSVIRKRLLDGRIIRANEGKRRIDKVYGYDSYYGSDGIRRLKINDAEADIVKFIFSEFRAGKSQRQIAIMLNTRSVPTKKTGKYVKQKKSDSMIPYAGKWSQPAIKCILKRPEYIGKVWDWNHEHLLPAFLDYIPPIITDETQWEWVKSNIESLSASRNRNGIRGTSHELSRVMTCSFCGAKYYFGSHNRPYYSHELKSKNELNCETKPKNIRVDIENIFRLTFINLFTEPTEIEQYIDDYKKSLSNEHEELIKTKKYLETEICKKTIAVEKLVNSLEELGNDRVVLKRIKERRSEINSDQLKIDNLMVSYDYMSTVLERSIREFSETNMHVFISSDPEIRRSLYLALIESCSVSNDIITLLYKNGKKYIIKFPNRIIKNLYTVDVYFKDDYQISAVMEDGEISYPKDRFVEMGKAIHEDSIEQFYKLGKALFSLE